MTDTLELSKPLHERVYERIRESIGDLMTDEDLKILVDKAAQKAFFEERPDPSYTGYGTKPILEAPMVKQLRELLDERVKTAVADWLKENPTIVQEAIDKAIQNGFSQAVAKALDSLMSNAMFQLQQNLEQSLVRR